MSLAESRLHLNSVMMSFGQLEILTGASMAVRPGEFVALVGPSGSGKSTLLSIMSGLTAPTGGAVYVQSGSLRYNPERFCAWVPQGGNSMPSRTVLENATIGALGAGRSRSDARVRAMDALALVGIDALQNKRANVLSGGELQRLAIARAACLDRMFVLADEPTGALDATTTSKVVDVLVALSRHQSAVVVATHDESVAQRADRVVSIADGRLLEVYR